LILGLVDLQGFLATFLRLGLVVFLLVIAIVFIRVFIELWIEERRKEALAATRNIHSLTPSEFEQYVGILFEKEGYRVKRTGYGDDIGPGAVRELIGAMTNARVTHGFLVTTSGFTDGAREEARNAPYEVRLVDGRGIVRWARKYGLPGELMD
jgi:restriction endonuclease Mrr